MGCVVGTLAAKLQQLTTDAGLISCFFVLQNTRDLNSIYIYIYVFFCFVLFYLFFEHQYFTLLLYVANDIFDLVLPSLFIRTSISPSIPCCTTINCLFD